MITLSQEDFDLALGYWQVQTTAVIGDESFDVITKFPYDYYPGQVTGGTIQPLNTKEAWDRYIWNPPEFDTEHFDIDETASGKPNWHQIVESAITARRELAVKKLRAVCQDKITRDAFGEDTLVGKSMRPEALRPWILLPGRRRLQHKLRPTRHYLLPEVQ